jgi:hydroxymethylpyrimidine pyrophosphatase-like HAD family hydrolase
MRFVALATGFDEALARDGQYDAHCATALRMLAATGRKLILATARDLRDLLEVFPPAQLFDYVIAENGGVLYQPALRRSAILARAPSEVLLQELRRHRVEPLAVAASAAARSE